MKRYIKNLVLLCGLSWIASAIELTIDQPGIYELGASIVSLPVAGPDQIIVIASSDVIFDLGEFVISQGNAVATVDGILINSNLNDIVIRNGMIRGVTQTAVSISSGASRILIENMKIDQCARGVVAVSVSDLTIQACQFTRCVSAAASQNLLNFSTSNRVLLKSILVSDANYTNLASLPALIFFTDSSQFAISELTVYSSFYSGVNTIMRTITCSNFLFSKIVISSCTNSGDAFLAVNGSRNMFENFYVNNHSGRGNTIFNAEAACIITKAVLSASDSNLEIIGVSNSYMDLSICSANRNVSGNQRGYFVRGIVNVTINKSIGVNISASALSSGLEAVLAPNTLAVVDCIFNRNRGSTPANSFGVQFTGGTNILFARNRAFSNNTTAATSQYTGVAAGAVTTVASTNINGSLQTPWTNLSVPA